MEKKFTKFELARLKRTAQNVEQFVSKKNKIVAQMKKLQVELDATNELIELADALTINMTGYHSEDIIKKVITNTDKLDKNGNIVKVVTFEFIYPDTILPPIVEEETVVEAVVPEAGSDYDLDSENI